MVKRHPESPYWSADITYIQLVNGRWVYLSSVYDPIKRHVVGYAIDNRMTMELVNRSFSRALSCARRPKYLHSDMGSQYTSELFESNLRRHQMQHSYSLKGYPYG
ncbi:transposase family protein [Leuconostoc gelidum subsp. gelidum]|uniref:DDE-type integrase/transposase/recombinase n=1 Tax=Leuconostoc gelidum TaxID=1244 RepID=UPI001CC49CBB|nr:DDE-type integrase/transposase/recombinase [Leuconostoc gelidum]MBZ6013630.1 transposase family protein [Leuconostoc gelidum subsp. gelidum]